MSHVYHDEEDEEYRLPFEGIEKSSTLQHCRVFNESPLNVSVCIDALLEVLYLLSTGTELTPDEATDLFFQSTKLLQATTPRLRRLHYVLMKELSPLVEQSFMASNSLMVDTKSSNDSTKSNAIRTLYAVMDSNMYGTMDRTITESMTSRNPNVVTAALVTGIHIARTNADLAKKWVTQLSELIKERNKAQYPAIALLHQLRRNDRLSMQRLMEQASNYNIRTPLALCLVIKMGAELMREDLANSQSIYRFIERIMQTHENEMVVFEAAKAFCSLHGVPAEIVKPVVQVLARYLNYTRPVVRFTAVYQLNHLAATYPELIEPYNGEIEMLINNSDRLIETLAVTTLMKTCNEASMERLFAKLSANVYLGDLGDEFKIIIVDGLRRLNVKFPERYGILLGFLYRVLSGEGSCQLKQKVVDTMIDIARSNDEAKEAVLTHLAEFVDDCEFPSIMKDVLIYLGDEAPLCANPRKFVRYVYNHATLEQAEIRAVAINTLAKIAARVPALRHSILTLLRRSCTDSDDEVRDRAVLYAKLFTLNDADLIRSLVDDIAAGVAATRRAARQRLESATKAGSAGAHAEEDGGLDRSTATASLTAARSATTGAAANTAIARMDNSGGGALGGFAPRAEERGVAGGATGSTEKVSIEVSQGREELRRVKQLLALGEPLKSSDPVLLTESDSDFVVSVIKHILPSHLVLQFKLHNTMDDMTFRNIAFLTETDDLAAEPLFAVPMDEVGPGATRYGYVVLEFSPPEFPFGAVESTFRFSLQEADAAPVEADGEGDEEYALESFDVEIADYVVPAALGTALRRRWDELAGSETTGTYALSSMRNLVTAARELGKFFGMYVEGGVPEVIEKASHTLFMSGHIADTAHTLMLVQARVFVTTDSSVALQLTLRGGDVGLREYLANALVS